MSRYSKYRGMAFQFKKYSLFRVGFWDEWETNAIMVSYDRLRDVVRVKRYDHCSCYGSEEAVLDGDFRNAPHSDKFSDIVWDWEGSCDRFAEIAKKKIDYKVTMRTIRSNDYDVVIVQNLYAIFLEWLRNGKPAWKDKKIAISQD